MESYGYAIADSSKALELDSSYVKVGTNFDCEVSCTCRTTTGKEVARSLSFDSVGILAESFGQHCNP
jgi:hypothetical protein